MHYKKKPVCKELSGTFLPEEVTAEMKEKHIGVDYINIKFCAQCPHCQVINEKKTRVNML
jgi:phage FluMu protein Com